MGWMLFLYLFVSDEELLKNYTFSERLDSFLCIIHKSVGKWLVP